MLSTIQCFTFATVSLGLLTAAAADPAVQQAKYVPSVQPSSSAQVVRFSQQPTEVGSRVLQQVSVDLELNSTIIQSGQIANQSTTSIRRRQERLIEALEVAQGGVRRAKVSFPLSRIKSPVDSDPKTEVTQTVEGKSYLVTRNGQQLLITDTDGVLPPREQYEIVLSSIQTLGLPNPLAHFLTSRTIRLGDRLQLPKEVANRLMGFGDQLGQVQRFELELKELRQIDGQNCALFDTNFNIVEGSDAPTTIDVQGQVIIETATCRTIAASFSGPLKMKAFDANNQYTAEGSLQVAIRSRYDKALK